MVKLNKVEAQFPDEVTLEFKAVLAYVTFRNGMSLYAFQLALFHVHTKKLDRFVVHHFQPRKIFSVNFRHLRITLVCNVHVSDARFVAFYTSLPFSFLPIAFCGTRDPFSEVQNVTDLPRS